MKLLAWRGLVLVRFIWSIWRSKLVYACSKAILWGENFIEGHGRMNFV